MNNFNSFEDISMKKLLIATTALIAVPAFAQMAPATPPSTTTQSSTTTQTAPADPAASASTTTQTDTTSTTTTATPSDPKALIASEFPTYDKDANGSLNKAEFATWIGALKSKSDATPTPAAEMTKYTDGAFATADKDKSKTISLAELQSYLTAGA
jgi:hypothetical protein